MSTYAEYLATMTVKTLNSICKQAGIKGYSKLRKAELVKGIAAMAELAEIEAHKANETAEKNVVCMYCGERFVSVAASMDHISECDGSFEDLTAIEDLIAEVVAEMPTTAPESVAAAVFSSAPKATVATPEIKTEIAVETIELADLKDAYRNLSRTINRMGGRGAEGQRRIKYVGQLRKISAELKSYGIKNPALI